MADRERSNSRDNAEESDAGTWAFLAGLKPNLDDVQRSGNHSATVLAPLSTSSRPSNHTGSVCYEDHDPLPENSRVSDIPTSGSDAGSFGDLFSSSSDEAGPVGQMERGFVQDQPNQSDESESSSGTEGDLSEDIQEDPSLFDYMNPIGEPPTRQEMLSFALHDITLKHKIAREAARDTSELFAAVVSETEKPLDYRTVKKRVEQRTGVKEVIYECCPHSHMSYAMYPDLNSCTHCNHPRWKDQNAL